MLVIYILFNFHQLKLNLVGAGIDLHPSLCMLGRLSTTEPYPMPSVLSSSSFFFPFLKDVYLLVLVPFVENLLKVAFLLICVILSFIYVDQKASVFH